MSTAAVKMAYRLSHNGVMMPIDDLEYEHVNALLSIFHLFQNLDTAYVDKAFGEGKQYAVDDQCVKDLFDWKYLNWEEYGKTFSLNKGGVFLDDIIARWRMLQEQQDQSKQDSK